MPDHKAISSRLIIAFCEIIDKAKAAIEEAEENTISDEENAFDFETIPPDDIKKCRA